MIIDRQCLHVACELYDVIALGFSARIQSGS